MVTLDQPATDRDPEDLSALVERSGPGVASEIVELSAWAARRFAGPRRAVLRSGAAPRVVRHLPRARRFPAVESWAGWADPRAVEILDRGGGVLWWPPTWDVLAVVAAAAVRGPTLVVVPSRDVAEVLARRARRAGASVACLPEDWASAAGGVDVVIGARAAVWGPCRDLAAIVVVDEHDEALVEERSPTWNATVVAEERARRAGVPVIITSPCPSAVTALRHRLSSEDPPSAARNAWPALEVVDVEDRAPWDRFTITDALRRHLADPTRRVVCVLNTTGRARLVGCRDCGSMLRCERCEAAVAQDRDGALSCPRCATTRPPVCEVCLGARLRVIRPGVARLERDLAAAARRPVVTITASGLHTVAAGEVAGVHDGEPAVFVGTEAVLHRIRRAEVVAFVDLDAELLAPRYRAVEQTVALLARAARIVGPRTKGGRILVQTAMPDHEVFRALAVGAPQRLLAGELERRRALGFPPYGALATLEGPGLGEDSPDGVLAPLRTAAAAAQATLRGPVGDRWLLSAPDPDTLADILAGFTRPARSRIRVVVDPPRV